MHIYTHIAHGIGNKNASINNADARRIAKYAVAISTHVNDVVNNKGKYCCGCRVAVVDANCQIINAIDTKYSK